MSAPRESWRAYFPAAAALAVTGLGAWGVQLGGLDLGLEPGDHAAFLVWGAFGTGVQGFLYTAYAKQNDAPLPGRTRLHASLTAQVVGAAVLLAPRALPTPLAVGLVALPWALLLTWTVGVAQPSLARKWCATTASVPVTVLAALVGSVLHVTDTVESRGLDVGVHAFLVPIALAVVDRILPFFSGRVTPGYDGRRRPWFLGPILALGCAKALAPWGSVPQRVVDVLLIALLLRQWGGWRPWPAIRTPMIAALHLGLAWCALGWGLGALGAPRSAALHALLVGALGSWLLALTMRVARGHAGLPLVIGRAGTAILALGQLAAIGRVAAVLTGSPQWLLLGSAALLMVAFAVWIARFLPVAWALGRRGEGPPPSR